MSIGALALTVDTPMGKLEEHTKQLTVSMTNVERDVTDTARQLKTFMPEVRKDIAALHVRVSAVEARLDEDPSREP